MISTTDKRTALKSSLGAVGLSALGIVFGDIGTSPLYTLKTVLALTGGQARQQGCDLDLADVTYYVGHETLLSREDGRGLARWIEALFDFMQRNSLHAGDYFRLPSDAVIEIGRQISI